MRGVRRFGVRGTGQSGLNSGLTTPKKTKSQKSRSFFVKNSRTPLSLKESGPTPVPIPRPVGTRPEFRFPTHLDTVGQARVQPRSRMCFDASLNLRTPVLLSAAGTANGRCPGFRTMSCTGSRKSGWLSWPSCTSDGSPGTGSGVVIDRHTQSSSPRVRGGLGTGAGTGSARCGVRVRGLRCGLCNREHG